jgi:hypothetical protein
MDLIMLIPPWWLVACVGVGEAASQRGRGFFNWTIGAIFLSPIFAVLLLMAFPIQERKAFDEREGQVRKLVVEG